MRDFLPPDDAKRLIALCRAGKLYDLEKWIGAGQSIRTSEDYRKTPLHVAIEIGFHKVKTLKTGFLRDGWMYNQLFQFSQWWGML